MFCGKCGTRNPDAAVYCQSCGKPLTGEERHLDRRSRKVKDPEEIQMERPVIASRPRKKVFGKIIVFAIIAALVLLIIFLLGEWHPEPIQFNIGVEFSDGICGDFRITVINCRLTRWLVSLVKSAC